VRTNLTFKGSVTPTKMVGQAEKRSQVLADGQRYFTFPKEQGGDAVWPFDKPHYLILNLAIGGTWGGQQGIDDSVFPARFAIDYVRVYRP
jgi:hypothetical protein